MSEYAEGGYIGTPDGDSIPVVIHPGEVWITAEQARRVLNIEWLGKLNGGGEVHIIDEEDGEQ